MTDNAGLYLHIPFCEKRCKYCSFYSSFVSEELLDSYTSALIKSIEQWGGKFNRPIDTIYLGGGTPSLLGHRLPTVLDAVRKNFDVRKNSEITLEINPHSACEELLYTAKTAGVNRLSVGAQSGDDNELSLLGRTHTALDTEKTVKTAKKLGFSNISVDLMIGLPDSTVDSAKRNVDFVLSLEPEHISSYILKIEENTGFAHNKSLILPDDDAVCDQYLMMCGELSKNGYSHYEISNFAKSGFESRHNNKYWLGTDYLGIGPSAHSFVDGKRFYYPPDLKAFIRGADTVSDGAGGDMEEYIMLGLRKKNGISEEELKSRFGKGFSPEFESKCKLFENAGYLVNDGRVSLTDRGMLISNSIITELLECLE